ncbi:hypothetical protein J7L06_04680 [Candidatus Bathyarchaeota archaeon]|nr:hypothetical protein [Candidatus Bathyarchaeota archaeon]
MRGNGVHYYDYPDWKGVWIGAGERVFGHTKAEYLPFMLIRRVLTAPLKAIPPAIAYNDPSIIIHNSRYWFRYLIGWLKPHDHIFLKRQK